MSVRPDGRARPTVRGMMSVVVEPMSIRSPDPSARRSATTSASANQFEAAARSGRKRMVATSWKLESTPHTRIGRPPAAYSHASRTASTPCALSSKQSHSSAVVVIARLAAGGRRRTTPASTAGRARGFAPEGERDGQSDSRLVCGLHVGPADVESHPRAPGDTGPRSSVESSAWVTRPPGSIVPSGRKATGPAGGSNRGNSRIGPQEDVASQAAARRPGPRAAMSPTHEVVGLGLISSTRGPARERVVDEINAEESEEPRKGRGGRA